MHDLRTRPTDAIVWRASAPQLLPLMPRAWMDTLKREHLDLVAEHRRSGHSSWPCQVNMASGAKGVNSISANGDIFFHRDEDFPPYAYLLIVRPAGYVVTGYERWRGLEQDRAGDLICFRQKTHKHALAVSGSTRDGAIHLDLDMEVELHRPGRLWLALTLDSDQLMTRSQAIEAYEQRLKSLPINLLKNRDGER